MKKIAILNGPNLDRLGKREPEIYGRATLADLEQALRAEFGSKARLEFFQSNHEGALIDKIAALADAKFDGIVINGAAFTHTSVALRDALLDDAEERSAHTRRQFRESLLWMGLLTSVLMLLVAGMLHVTRQRIILPLSQASQALQAMRQGDLTVTLPTSRLNDEIAAVFGGIAALQQQSLARVELERERDKLIDSLREQSITDFLTGLPNRRAFFTAAGPELARARRHGFNLVVLLMDVDHFKVVNDSAGHAAGDRALVAVANRLQQTMRQGDLAARLGGEEFVALLSHCSLEAGLAFADRLREAIQSEAIDVGEGKAALHLTVSIGLADAGTHGHELDALLARADEAMYRAKHEGRNRTEWAGRAA